MISRERQLEQNIKKLHKQAYKALQQAVYKAAIDHDQTGDPMVVWKNGRVAKIPAKEVIAEYKHLRIKRKKVKK